MSDSSQLYFLDRRERPQRNELEEINSKYLSADWHLPIGWLAMLAPGDLHVDLSASRDQNTPYFAVDCKTAIARLDERLLWLKSAVPGLQPAWLDSFRRFVSDSKFRWAHIEPVAIFENVGDDSVEKSERLNDLFAAFDEQPAAVGKIAALTPREVSRTPSQPIFRLHRAKVRAGRQHSLLKLLKSTPKNF